MPRDKPHATWQRSVSVQRALASLGDLPARKLPTRVPPALGDTAARVLGLSVLCSKPGADAFPLEKLEQLDTDGDGEWSPL